MQGLHLSVPELKWSRSVSVIDNDKNIWLQPQLHLIQMRQAACCAPCGLLQLQMPYDSVMSKHLLQSSIFLHIPVANCV